MLRSASCRPTPTGGWWWHHIGRRGGFLRRDYAGLCCAAAVSGYPWLSQSFYCAGTPLDGSQQSDGGPASGRPMVEHSMHSSAFFKRVLLLYSAHPLRSASAFLF